ncbi:hypothetical protein FA15DRAFT_694891 [Coprinopsis marcescibilis]|uniref:Uncharacterized protein n=1 Tax=Coprinopsis marcescibilis TaxID=230819 RepID=A0A5C3KV72_COPMA|nr:hypothetical protein FA15DRAFT_694891 [Coprinopsis marcescibilis]
MLFKTPLPLLPLLLLLAPTTNAQRTASLIAYSTTQCCGGSVGYTNIPANKCVQNANPSVFGQSLQVTGAIWGTGTGADSNKAYGYFTGYSDAGCKTPVYEIRAQLCWGVGGLRAGSWKWTEEVYEPWIRRALGRVNGTATEEEEEGVDARGEVEVEVEEVGDWVGYFDGELGRERRVATGGSKEVFDTILDLHAKSDISALRLFRDLEQGELTPQVGSLTRLNASHPYIRDLQPRGPHHNHNPPTDDEPEQSTPPSAFKFIDAQDPDPTTGPRTDHPHPSRYPSYQQEGSGNGKVQSITSPTTMNHELDIHSAWASDRPSTSIVIPELPTGRLREMGWQTRPKQPRNEFRTPAPLNVQHRNLTTNFHPHIRQKSRTNLEAGLGTVHVSPPPCQSQ